MKNFNINSRLCKNMLFVFLTCLFANSAIAASLMVTVESIAESRGQLYLSLFDSKEAFGKEQMANKVENATKGQMKFEFTDLADGDYAVMVYQDLNGNEKLDTNLIGLPKEPWGGSLQGKRLYGPPGYVM